MKSLTHFYNFKMSQMFLLISLFYPSLISASNFYSCYTCDSEKINYKSKSEIAANHHNLRCIAPHNRYMSQISNSTVANVICPGICYTEITAKHSIFRACLTEDELDFFYSTMYYKYFIADCIPHYFKLSKTQQSRKIREILKNSEALDQCKKLAFDELKYESLDNDEFFEPDQENIHDPDYETEVILKKAEDGSKMIFCKSDLCNGKTSKLLYDNYVEPLIYKAGLVGKSKFQLKASANHQSSTWDSSNNNSRRKTRPFQRPVELKQDELDARAERFTEEELIYEDEIIPLQDSNYNLPTYSTADSNLLKFSTWPDSFNIFNVVLVIGIVVLLISTVVFFLFIRR